MQNFCSCSGCFQFANGKLSHFKCELNDFWLQQYLNCISCFFVEFCMWNTSNVSLHLLIIGIASMESVQSVGCLVYYIQLASVHFHWRSTTFYSDRFTFGYSFKVEFCRKHHMYGMKAIFKAFRLTYTLYIGSVVHEVHICHSRQRYYYYDCTTENRLCIKYYLHTRITKIGGSMEFNEYNFGFCQKARKIEICLVTYEFNKLGIFSCIDLNFF